MQYLVLSREAYNDLILAAGLKAGAVAKVCNEQGVWSKEAQAEAPPGVEMEEVPTVQTALDFEVAAKVDETKTGTEPVAEPAPEEPQPSAGELPTHPNDPRQLMV